MHLISFNYDHVRSNRAEAMEEIKRMAKEFYSAPPSPSETLVFSIDKFTLEMSVESPSEIKMYITDGEVEYEASYSYPSLIDEFLMVKAIEVVCERGMSTF